MNPFLVIILVILIGDYFLTLIVEFLNLRYLSPGLPDEFKGFYDKERYLKSQKYLRDTTSFGIIHESIITPMTIIFLLFGGFDLVDQFARGFGLASISTGLIFAAIILLASQILNLPFLVYSTFVIEEKYGFNKTTIKTFILDILKTLVLGAIIGGGIFLAILWFFEKAGPWAWFYCWITLTVIQVFLMYLAPVIIMPLFNKFIPLEDGTLKNAIENYAVSQDFRIKGVFKMDGSKRSTKSNAFFTGFGKFRRIVLFDTLIENHSEDELVSVLAHEIGHCKKKHTLKLMLISICTTGILFYILSQFISNPVLFDAFKMQETSIYAGLIFFGFLYTPIDMILSVFVNLLSRKHEYQADNFAISTYGEPKSMINALKKITVDNLSNLTPHPLKVFLEYSHPPVLERINAIRKHSI